MQKYTSRPAQLSNMKRILVVRLDFLGDMLCTTAFLRALKEHWPQARIHVLANKYNRAVLDGNPDVETIHTYVYSKQFERNDRPGMFNALFARAALVLRLRRLAFDLVIVPNGGTHKNSVRFARQVRAKTLRWHNAETEFDDRRPEHIATRPIRHEALSGFALMPELAPPALDALRLYVFPDVRAQAGWEAQLPPTARPRVGFFISNKAAQRRWDLRKWGELADALASRADIIIFRDPGDERQLVDVLTRRACVLAPPSVRDLIAATSLVDLVVSADSAPVHLASALRLPVVAMFEDKPEKVLRWHPLGTPYVLLHAGPDVDAIEANRVAAAANELLDRIVVHP